MTYHLSLGLRKPSRMNHVITVGSATGWGGYQLLPTMTGWWYTYPSGKYEFVSWDDEIPNILKVIKVMFQTINQKSEEMEPSNRKKCVLMHDASHASCILSSSLQPLVTRH